MLSSDTDGERASAVASIGRVLKSHDRDWLDFAGSVAAPAPAREPLQAQANDGSSATMRAEDLIDLITMIRDSGAGFDPHAEEFLDGLLGRARIYASVFISRKQRCWLDDLVRKAKVAGT
jgi:hypothetical protein